MRNIKTYELFKSSKNEKGDELVSRIIDIVEKENIEITHSGGYRVEIDDKIYSFSKFSRFDSTVYIYDVNQKIYDPKYGEIITGKPLSKYSISNKMFKTIEKMYKDQQQNISSDLDDLDPVNRSAKKYNL